MDYKRRVQLFEQNQNLEEIHSLLASVMVPGTNVLRPPLKSSPVEKISTKVHLPLL